MPKISVYIIVIFLTYIERLLTLMLSFTKAKKNVCRIKREPYSLGILRGKSEILS